MVKSARTYFRSIDGLRAIAVIAVILHHLNETVLPGGYLGVDIFFVISGFVISNSLHGRNQPLGAFIKGFYARRVKRLFPALLLCVGATAITFSILNQLFDEHRVTGVFSLFGLSNIALFLNELDYWGTDAKLNPFTHTWSLGVEEQFYLVFPLLFWFLIYRRYKSESPYASFFKTIAGLAVFSLAAFWLVGQYNSSATFYLSPFRFWELALGALIFSVTTENGHKKTRLKAWQIAIVFIALLSTFALSVNDMSVAVPAAVILSGVLIYALATMEKGGFVPLSNPVAVYIGKISYSLYLWHWPVVVFWRWKGWEGGYQYLIQILLIFAFSAASYHFVEKPLRYAAWFDKKGKVALACAIFTVLCAGLFFTIGGDKEFDDTMIVDKTPLSENFRCVENPNGMTIRVIGNSHVINILPVIGHITKECNIHIVEDDRSKRFIIPTGMLNREIEKLDEVFSPLKEGDLLILSSRNQYIYQIPYLNGRGDIWVLKHLKQINKGEGKVGLNKWLSDLDAILKRAKAEKVNVMLILPNVEFDTRLLPIKVCRRRKNLDDDMECNPRVSREFLDSRFSERFYEEVFKRAAKDKLFTVFDPLPIFCPEEKTHCSRIVNGVFAFGDTNHLSPEGSVLMAHDLAIFLDENNLISFENVE